MVHSDACLHGRSHDGDMAGGEELSGAVETVATEAKRARELGGKEEELTTESERGTASSGRSWRRRIERRRPAAVHGEEGHHVVLGSSELA